MLLFALHSCTVVAMDVFLPSYCTRVKTMHVNCVGTNRYERREISRRDTARIAEASRKSQLRVVMSVPQSFMGSESCGSLNIPFFESQVSFHTRPFPHCIALHEESPPRNFFLTPVPAIALKTLNPSHTNYSFQTRKINVAMAKKSTRAKTRQT